MRKWIFVSPVLEMVAVLPHRSSANSTATAPAIDSNNLPWVEKYRPKTISKVASQTEIISILKNCLQSENLPHLLFYGPPGTGKTSTILALARDLFGPILYRSRILELNASDERGIDVIRDKVKTFARITAGHEKTSGYPCPPFKLIILDEADLLTSDAQTALRRIMERNSRTTRFCIICNYVSRIIEPLTSRCAKFRFRPIDETSGVARLKEIVDAEKVKLDTRTGDSDGVLRELLQSCGGDLRSSITLLQSSHCYMGSVVGISQIEELSGKVPSKIITEALDLCKGHHQTKDGGGVRQLSQWIQQNIMDEAYAAGTFLQQLLQVITTDPDINTERKAAIALKISHPDFALTEGANEYLQLVNFLSQCQFILSHPRGDGHSIKVMAF